VIVRVASDLRKILLPSVNGPSVLPLAAYKCGTFFNLAMFAQSVALQRLSKAKPCQKARATSCLLFLCSTINTRPIQLVTWAQINVIGDCTISVETSASARGVYVYLSTNN
jgi:hypothetical protein